jgi:fumarate hydratase subunit alpha
MREIHIDQITQAVKGLFLKATVILSEDAAKALKKGFESEESPMGREVLRCLLENAEAAKADRIPICQDTGRAILFVEVGQDVHLVGGNFMDALEEGVRQAYTEGYLRKSVCHPLTRKNTGDNTPAVVHTLIVPGDRIKISAMPKGEGSENMSRVFMLRPTVGWEGVKEKVIETVSNAGPNPCPPITVGVAVGGSFGSAARDAQKTLLRAIGQPNPDPEVARLEAELLEAINRLGIGPQGMGGRVTALAVHINLQPCHIASLPLGVNLQCHAARHAEVTL